jgi:hypothetical protein
LIDQVRRCFNVKIRWFKEAHERGISAVYIMASGDISTQAREAIHGFCEKEKYGENVYLLDGGRLERLNQFATRARDEAILNRLRSLVVELEANTNLMSIIITAFEKEENIGVARCRLGAIEGILADFPNGDLDLFKAQQVWNLANLVNRFAERDTLPFRRKLTDEIRKERADFFKTSQILFVDAARAVRSRIHEIEQRYTITAEVKNAPTQEGDRDSRKAD